MKCLGRQGMPITSGLLVTFGLGVLFALAAAPTASAQTNYPTRVIKLIVPFPAGGINDVLARVWTNKATSYLGTVIGENHGGAGA